MNDGKIPVTFSYDEVINQWGAWIPSVAAYGQGDTSQEALKSLQDGLRSFTENIG